MELFSVIVKVGNGEFRKYRNLKKSDIRKLFDWLINKGFGVLYMNVYDKKTREQVDSFTMKKQP